MILITITKTRTIIIIKLSLFLIKLHDKKTYWELEIHLHAYLTFAQDYDNCSSSFPGRLTPSQGDHVTSCREGECTTEPVWILCRKEKTLPSGFNPTYSVVDHVV
jgi:hypothetical protein